MALAAELAYLGWLAGEELTRQKNVALARDYFAGEHAVPLTDRQRAYLGFQSGGRFAANYCKPVVNAVVEKLLVAGLQCADEAVSAWAWRTWLANRMDGLQGDVHRAAVCDGEAFVMVDWEGGRPRFVLHPRYVSSQAGGDGFGCKAFYPNDDPRLPMLYATKRWTETVAARSETGLSGSRKETRQRLTVYFPARVEKYVLTTSNEAGWAPFAEEDGGTWPVAWMDGAGRPLGIPVVHFRNPDLRSELWDAVPLQDAINKALLDLLASLDANGFQTLFAKGFYATTDENPPAKDGSNYLTVAPGQIIGTTAPDAALTAIAGADVQPMIEGLWTLVLVLAQVTDTPVSRFQISRQVASAESQKEAEAALLAKVRGRQTSFGNAWEDVLGVARRLEQAFGTRGLDEAAAISTQWAPAETRDEKEHIEMLGLKREKLNVPLAQIWAEAGYSQDEIAAMMASPEMQARVAGERMAAALGSGG